MSAVELLIGCAGDSGVEALSVQPGSAVVAIELKQPSGVSIRYLIELADIAGDHVRAREQKPLRLPGHCPERHINFDGSFCLYWADEEGRPVTDVESARTWWELLLAYLRRQETASRTHRWFGPARAHGEGARFQADAERLASRLGSGFSRLLNVGAFSIRRDLRRNKVRIELWRDGRRVGRVSQKTGALVNVRTSCPCDAASVTGTALEHCGTHANDLALFILAMDRWMSLEWQFMQTLRKAGVKCCGTMQACALRA